MSLGRGIPSQADNDVMPAGRGLDVVRGSLASSANANSFRNSSFIWKSGVTTKSDLLLGFILTADI